MRSPIRGSVLAALPLVLLFACSDGGPLVPRDEAELVPLQLSANLSGTPVDVLVVEVTAADIPTPLAYNLRVVNGNASGSIQIPPGLARLITVRAYESDGSVTHDGSATVDVARGNNPPLHIPLIPRSGHQPIDVTLAEVSITIEPNAVAIVTGEVVTLQAYVVAAGGSIAATVGWATLNPAVATVDDFGNVHGLIGGTAVVVATYAGVGAAITVQVLTGMETDWYADLDGDGFGDPNGWLFIAIPPAGYVDNHIDCDDTNAATNPAAPELFDSQDNNCDGTVDEGFVPIPWYLDADEDLYGNSSLSVMAIDRPIGYAGQGGDCDDGNAMVNPSAEETAGDGIDNDCNGVVDDALAFWYADEDADGFGDPNNWVQDFFPFPGFVSDSSDCDDSSALVFPGAPESPNGIDDDCDGEIDEGL